MRHIRRQIQRDDKQIRIAFIILLAFLAANIIGAMLCNGIYGTKTSGLALELKNFFTGVKENGVTGSYSFSTIYWKYLKYSLFIWIGGWLSYGCIISGVALCFRGLSLGFTTAMLLRTYGFKGFFVALLTIVPQNLILIPAYLILTWAATCFWLRRGRSSNGKAGLRREKNKQYTEYSIFLMAAILLIAVATLVEAFVIPVFMKGIALFL